MTIIVVTCNIENALDEYGNRFNPDVKNSEEVDQVHGSCAPFRVEASSNHHYRRPKLFKYAIRPRDAGVLTLLR